MRCRQVKRPRPNRPRLWQHPAPQNTHPPPPPPLQPHPTHSVLPIHHVQEVSEVLPARYIGCSGLYTTLHTS